MELNMYDFRVTYDAQANRLLLVDTINKKARHLEFDEIRAIGNYFEDNK